MLQGANMLQAGNMSSLPDAYMLLWAVSMSCSQRGVGYSSPFDKWVGYKSVARQAVMYMSVQAERPKLD